MQQAHELDTHTTTPLLHMRKQEKEVYQGWMAKVLSVAKQEEGCSNNKSCTYDISQIRHPY